MNTDKGAVDIDLDKLESLARDNVRSITLDPTTLRRLVEMARAAEMEARKDAAYLERNQVVAALAKCFPSGIARTSIEGWSEDWHGCVYIDLPTGQASWHFHDSQSYLFDGLPPYAGKWDGHTTEEKYERISRLAPTTSTVSAPEEVRNRALEEIAAWYSEKGWLMDEDDIAGAIRALKRTAAPEAPASEQHGQWVRCTPDLIKAGVSCSKTPRRPGDGTYSHDHFITHAATTASEIAPLDEKTSGGSDE